MQCCHKRIRILGFSVSFGFTGPRSLVLGSTIYTYPIITIPSTLAFGWHAPGLKNSFMCILDDRYLKAVPGTAIQTNIYIAIAWVRPIEWQAENSSQEAGERWCGLGGKVG